MQTNRKLHASFAGLTTGAQARAGIGLSMSLFVAGEAFPPADFSADKIGVFAASALSAIVGTGLLLGSFSAGAFKRQAKFWLISYAPVSRRTVNRRSFDEFIQ
jgi:NhaA family Na+:H+ antiporter